MTTPGMSEVILRSWLCALDVPVLTDTFQTSAPNEFYVSFRRPLMGSEKARIQALGFSVAIEPPFTDRYHLVWQPPLDDER